MFSRRLIKAVCRGLRARNRSRKEYGIGAGDRGLMREQGTTGSFWGVSLFFFWFSGLVRAE